MKHHIIRRFFAASVSAFIILFTGPVAANDVQLVSLKATSQHAASKVWSGRFRGLNGRDYNASAFYKPTKPQLSATGLLMINSQDRVSWLLPISIDAGYHAKLYQADPLASIGFGTAVSLDAQSVVTFRVDNLLVSGGKISERPCYDSYRRRYHCGSGLAWTDFEKTGFDRRGRLAVPSIEIKFKRRFSF